MARKFLYIVAFLIVLVLAGLFALRIWSTELTKLALVPSAAFEKQTPLKTNAYADPKLWLSRPGMANDPARWQPPVGTPATDAASDAASGAPSPDASQAERQDYAVFFIHPTSYLDRAHWNAPLAGGEADRIAQIYVKGMASPFNQAKEIWAPRYRQATFGAFLTDQPEATQAIDAAYADVHDAFTYFLSQIGPDTPIVLAGHSQGALHLLRLLRQDVANKPLAGRIAAVYAIGWPISVQHDLAGLGLPGCDKADQAGCVMSWSSYAEPADPSMVLDTYRNSIGFDGQPRGDSPILCTNPLTGKIGGSAPASANLGTLVPDEELTKGRLVAGYALARCDERGLLLIGEPPAMGNAVLPGNNYHVYDIPLFWKNLQRDVTRRVKAWQGAQ
ncbi:DUF3089 domain-containing protein [Altererythrobacter sp. FM1]|uniref:DUF3089 domain-containing protein n=1 Tax=Tsuneonella flava TaxID=2055955 RepID=UPI000C80AE3E|nr:DUF3089 domain-containing protein [Tsuneonella flava]ROT94948.1 DUF3089 domain-containing protein [Altererythrobacter sp. FM1]